MPPAEQVPLAGQATADRLSSRPVLEFSGGGLISAALLNVTGALGAKPVRARVLIATPMLATRSDTVLTKPTLRLRGFPAQQLRARHRARYRFMGLLAAGREGTGYGIHR